MEHKGKLLCAALRCQEASPSSCPQMGEKNAECRVSLCVTDVQDKFAMLSGISLMMSVSILP